MTPPDICPVCGAEVPSAASACPDCGADDTTGWNAASTRHDGLDLPDDEFDYDAYAQREFGNARPTRRPGKSAWPWRWIIGAALGLLALSLVLRATR